MNIIFSQEENYIHSSWLCYYYEYDYVVDIAAELEAVYTRGWR